MLIIAIRFKDIIDFDKLVIMGNPFRILILIEIKNQFKGLALALLVLPLLTFQIFLNFLLKFNPSYKKI